MREMIHQGGELLPSRSLTSNLRSWQDHLRVRSDEVRFFCFPRGTLVLTDCEGYRPIEELHEGDLIKTYAAETQTESQSAVKEVVAGRSEKIVKINDMIAASPRQQILCDGMFQSAEALRLGGVLVSSRHQAILVTSIELVDSEQEVYSVALDKSVGYFVKGADAEDSIIVREAITGKV